MDNNNQKNIERLLNIGLNEREAKVYMALIEVPDATASDLQKVSGLRQNKIYEIIGNLVRQGYCSERKGGRVRTFEAIDPKDALMAPINQLQERLTDSINLQKELHELFNTAERTKDPIEYIEVIHGNENVHRKYVELLNNSKTEIAVIAKPPYASHSKELLKVQIAAFEKFLERGARDRIIFEMTDNPDNAMLHMIEESHKNNEEFRIGFELPPKMVIFDRKVLLTTDIDKYSKTNEFTSTVIRDQTTVDFYYKMYDKLWKDSLTYEQWIDTLDKPYKSVSIDDLDD